MSPNFCTNNNDSERALHGPVIQRKISWGSQSDDGMRLMDRLWIVAEACNRQLVNLFNYIIQTIETLRNSSRSPLRITRLADF